MVPFRPPNSQGDSSTCRPFFERSNAARAGRARTWSSSFIIGTTALINWGKSDEGRAPAGLFGEIGKAVVGAAALLLGLAFLSAAAPISARSPAIDPDSTVRVADLPTAARETLWLIKQGGPYPYSRDGVVFANRERRLPRAPHGTYREYTVKTPGNRDRGARRIIAAGSNRFWYSADHYRSFRRIVE